MSLTTLVNRPCTLIRRSVSGNTDRYGNDIPSEAYVVSVCEIQQEATSEEGGGAIAESRWVVFFRPDTQIDAGDGVLPDDGYEYEIVGDPWVARNPRTQAISHVEAKLRRAAGVEEAS